MKLLDSPCVDWGHRSKAMLFHVELCMAFDVFFIEKLRISPYHINLENRMSPISLSDMVCGLPQSHGPNLVCSVSSGSFVS